MKNLETVVLYAVVQPLLLAVAVLVFVSGFFG